LQAKGLIAKLIVSAKTLENSAWIADTILSLFEYITDTNGNTLPLYANDFKEQGGDALLDHY
jgi:hypothetical protein